MTLLLFYTGLLSVEGDEHKHQVLFCFKNLFANCCLILPTSARFWSVVLGHLGVKCLTINRIKHSDRNKYGI